MPYERFFLSDDKWPDTLFFRVGELPTDDPRFRDLVDSHPGSHWAMIFFHPDIDDPPAFMREHDRFVAAQVADHPNALAAVDPGGTIHWGKMVPVRLPLEAFVSWMIESRDASRVHGGNPDRPPDIDTPTTRQWIRHPGEPRLEIEEEDARSRGIDLAFPLAVIVHKVELPGVLRPAILKLIFRGEIRSGVTTYVSRMKIQDEETHDLIVDRELEMDADGLPDDWFTNLLQLIHEAYEPLIAYDDQPIVTTPNDFANAEKEVEWVQHEIAEFYGVPENWQHLEDVALADAKEMTEANR